MTVIELAAELAVEVEVVEQAVIANGFSTDDSFDARQKHLISAYVDYLIAMEDAREQRIAFKYTDGEESVDKTGVYDQYRRYALDLLGAWREAKRQYDDEMDGGSESFFMVRPRDRRIGG